MIAVNYLQFLAYWAITQVWTRWVQLMWPDSTIGKTLAVMN